MKIAYATLPTPGRVNEDFIVAGASWIAILDGATPPANVDSGCIHDVPWLVSRLGASISTLLATGAGQSLPGIVESAIEQTCAQHATTCDLANPASPSSTVAIARISGSELEYLSLADSPIVIGLRDDGVRVEVDDRTSHLRSYTVEAVRAARNTPDGFWVASTVPEAARHAVSGSIPLTSVDRVAVLSDGGARYVERFGLADWSGLLDVLSEQGPDELIERVRAAEKAETEEERLRERRRGKQHDDATAALLIP